MNTEFAAILHIRNIEKSAWTAAIHRYGEILLSQEQCMRLWMGCTRLKTQPLCGARKSLTKNQTSVKPLSFFDIS